MLLQLTDNATAAKHFPYWLSAYASNLGNTPYSFYRQASKAITANNAEHLARFGKLVLELHECGSKELQGLASQARGVAATLTDSEQLVGLVDVICLTSQHKELGASTLKQTLTTSLNTACGVVQDFLGWGTSLKAMGLPEEFVGAAIKAADAVMSTYKSNEATAVLKELQKHTKACINSFAAVPDPAANEANFLSFMSKNGTQISKHLKKVIHPWGHVNGPCMRPGLPKC
jgi:hypothetical protein